MKKETGYERLDRIQLTKLEQSTKGSKFYEFIPCEGTLVNSIFDEDNKQVQELNNYRVNKAPRQTSSTKVGAISSAKFSQPPIRNNRYQPQMLTVLLFMRMTKKQLLFLIHGEMTKSELLKFKDIKKRKLIELTNINRYYAFRAK